MELWENVLKDYDEIVHIPMSSGLSSSCATALSIAEEYDGRVQVVNNQRISVTQEQSVYDAMKLREEGKSAKEIREILEKEKFSLQYLYHGGHTEVSEKRRQNHPSGGNRRNSSESEAGSSDSGGETGCFRESAGLESSEEGHAECG